MLNSLWVSVFCLILAPVAGAQDFPFPEKAIRDPTALSEAMPTLAWQVLSVYKESDRDRHLDNLFRLQMVARDYSGAINSLASLRELRRQTDPGRAAWVNVQYEVYARARAKQETDKVAFEEAFKISLADAVKLVRD